jgi:beta-phosphoglucomutase
MSYDAILFDFDGVLMDSEPVHYECWKEVLAPMGIRIDWDRYQEHCIGASEPATMEYYSRLGQPPFDPDEIRARYPLKQELFRARMERELPFVPGIGEFLRSLDGRYKLGVVSSSSRAELEPLLSRGGILGFFQALVFGEDVERHKPAPDPYLLAARQLDARRALVVEDSDAGMESARRAGMEAVRIPEARRTVELVRHALICGA